MAERILTKLDGASGQWKDANHCSTCTNMASHSTTDAVQATDGTWTETKPRFGCGEHKVTPNVILIDGTVIPFAEYHVN